MIRYLLLIVLLTPSIHAAAGSANVYTKCTTNRDVTCAYGQLNEDNATGSTITVTTGGTYYPWVTAQACG